jgi:uncharacterized protein (DUF697 family)
MTKYPDEKWQLADSSIELNARVQRCRRLVKRRAFVAAGIAVIPVPGLDWLTDVGVLLKLIPEINQAFGLSAQQVDQLTPERRILVFKAISAAGGMLIGKVVTQQMVWHVLRSVGVRLTTQQVAKFVPIIGQTTSAALTFFALKHVCEHHIAQCVAVSQELLLLPRVVNEKA